MSPYQIDNLIFLLERDPEFRMLVRAEVERPARALIRGKNPYLAEPVATRFVRIAAKKMADWFCNESEWIWMRQPRLTDAVSSLIVQMATKGLKIPNKIVLSRWSDK